MNDIVSAFVAILTGILALAIISVLVSRNAQTSDVIEAGGNALTRLILAANSPVTGSNGNLGASAFSTPSIGSFLS